MRNIYERFKKIKDVANIECKKVFVKLLDKYLNPALVSLQKEK